MAKKVKKVSNRHYLDGSPLQGMLKKDVVTEDVVTEDVATEDVVINDEDLSLSELRLKYPNIKARSQNEFLKELRESKEEDE